MGVQETKRRHHQQRHIMLRGPNRQPSHCSPTTGGMTDTDGTYGRARRRPMDMSCASLSPDPTFRRRRRIFAPIIAIVTTLAAAGSNHRHVASAYVYTGLPAHTHRAFLQKLTDDICSSEPGSLSHEDVLKTPRLMSALATAPAPDTLNRVRDESGVERALAVERLLKRMIDERIAGNDDAILTTDDYNSLMMAWANSGDTCDAALRVEEILVTMQDLYNDGEDDVQPDENSFRIAIETWSNVADEPHSMARAQQILDWMVQLYSNGNNDKAKPATSCFYPLFKVWANSDKIEAPIMSEHLIMSMQHLQNTQDLASVQPDTTCFNYVVRSWIKSGDITSEKKIRKVFEYMDDCRRRGCEYISPDSLTYNMLVSSIGVSVKRDSEAGGARRADKLLRRMEQGFLAGDESLRPDTVIYNQVIDYWAKTQSVHGHYLKARDVLDRQISLYRKNNVRKCRPDTLSYTSVIGACASTYGSKMERRRSFNVAHRTFLEMCKNDYPTQPNDVTYGLMFKATGRLLHKQDERDRYSRTLWSLACDDGYLGEMAFNRFREAASDELFKELTNNRRNYADLPSDCTCNARPSPRQKNRRPKDNGKRLLP